MSVSWSEGLAETVDVNGAMVSIDEPTQLCAVVNQGLHFAFLSGEAVSCGKQFDEAVQPACLQHTALKSKDDFGPEEGARVHA
jgi:hypothetical protein